MAVKLITGKQARRCYRNGRQFNHGDDYLMRKYFALAFAILCGGAIGAMLGLGASLVF